MDVYNLYKLAYPNKTTQVVQLEAAAFWTTVKTRTGVHCTIIVFCTLIVCPSLETLKPRDILSSFGVQMLYSYW